MNEYSKAPYSLVKDSRPSSSPFVILNNKPTDVRKVVTPVKGKDGLFEDTGKYDEISESHLRDTFAKMFQYADPWSGDSRSFDLQGDYLCEDCNKYEPNACLAVEGKISGDHGSCRHWEDLDAGDAELKFAEKISKDMADYGETPREGFSCKRCEYMTQAKSPDSHGRSGFCKQGAFRVYGDGCCALNDTKGMKSFTS
jgi:hypothetical protein